jgi:hypothetical protein
MIVQAVDQVGAVLIREFAKAMVEVGDGVEPMAAYSAKY